MTGIIAKKIGMTSVFNEDGKNIPCTVVEAGPCYVSQLKTVEVDGYDAVQLAFDEKKEKRTTAALKGHFTKAGLKPMRKVVEFEPFNEDFKLGDEVKCEVFKAGDIVDVIGFSKGKGFQGVVKRHGFSGVGGRTHGQHNRERAPGSVGAASFPSRVFKGMRMAGRTGNTRVKVFDLEIVKVLSEENIIFIKGAVPGHKGAYVLIEK